MAIAFDAWARSANGWVQNVSSQTISHIVTGSNPFLVVGAGLYNTSARSVSGITYNGVALTKANSITSAIESANQDSELWYLDNPATGNHDIVVTLSGLTEFVQILSASYTGKTSTGIDANATSQDLTGSASSPPCNVTVVASDCWLTCFAYQRRNEAPAAGTGTTNRATGGSGHALGDSNGVVSTGSQTLAFTVSAGLPVWCGMNSLSFSAAGGGGGGLSVTIGQASETDLSQTLSLKKIKAIDQSSETDLAQAITSKKMKAVGQSSEVDSAQAVVRIKRLILGQSVETDLAQAAVQRGSTPVAQASEVDSAQAISIRKLATLGQPAELDSALAVALRKAKQIAIVSEADFAQAIIKQKLAFIAQVSETDLAQAVGHIGGAGGPAVGGGGKLYLNLDNGHLLLRIA